MPNPEVQILVCVNERPEGASKPCCSRRGALKVYHRFKDRVKELGIRDQVMVNRTGCLKHCSQGVAVAVWPWNRWYAGVEPEDVEEILQTTVLGQGTTGKGEAVERLVMPDIPWE
ncbi:MAG: (2Fe-2S) ferredoxin domain-containing protein [Acidobacteriota bacterium]|nr:(2Fe-2S) ferredoxin domain-containing protein [Acidobacteriota bacterium]